MSSVSSPTDLTRPPLRRATYVHVSDLTSAYNIDHVLLEQELRRAKTESDEASLRTEMQTDVSHPDIDPSGVATELEVALAANPQKRLQPPRGGYNLCVLVGKVNVVVDKRRVDGSRVRLAEVEIGDETGIVSLRARDEQIDVLEEISKRSGAAVLRNCTLELYQGRHIRLAVTKWGKLCVYPDSIASTPPPPSKMNFDRNFSCIDLSLVASEMVDSQAEGPYSGKQNKLPTESSDTGGRHGSSKTIGQSHTKHSSSSRRNSRDRRHPRGKSGGSQHPAHYSMPYGDLGMLQPQHVQMQYRGIPNFSRFEHGIDMRQFSYTHGGQQEVVSPGSQHHIMLQQQYEMQQRQFHQMYAHGQDHHLQSMNQGPAAGMILQPGSTSGGFTTGGPDPSVMPLAASNSMFMPIGLPAPALQSSVPAVASAPTEEYKSLMTNSEQSARKDSIATPRQAGKGPATQIESVQPKAVSPDESQLAGRMNPDATAFAPASYVAGQPYFQTFQQSQSPSVGVNYDSTPSASSVHSPQRPQMVHPASKQPSAKSTLPTGQDTSLSPNRSQSTPLVDTASNASTDSKSGASMQGQKA